MVLAWREKGKPTIMISRVFPAAMTRYDDRLGRSREKPLVVCKYNQSMGGVDKTDQYGFYYSFDCKSVKWWRKLMFWLLEVAIVNSYILYRETVVSPSSHADYRRQVVVSLCEQWPVRDVRRQLMRPSRDEERFQGRHYIERGQTRRRCIVCLAKGQRHETIYVCTSNPFR